MKQNNKGSNSKAMPKKNIKPNNLQNSSEDSLVKEKKNASVSKVILYLQFILNIVLIGAVIVAFVIINRNSEHLVEARQITEQNIQTLQQVSKTPVIYTFNLEKVVAASNLVNIQKDFEEQILKLNGEIDIARKKIARLKRSKVKRNSSDVYLKSLTQKRDELIQNHEQQMSSITEYINQALVEVAEEKNAPVIYNIKAVSVTTKHVIDVSDDVVAKINKKIGIK